MRSPRAWIYEHRSAPLLPWRLFLLRVAKHGGISAGLVAFSLLIGTAGYHAFAGFSWTDSFLNASMLLGGMGPVGDFHGDDGKLFASFFALYSGLVFVVAGGIVFAPTLHRLLHRLHLEEKDAAGDGRS